MGKVIVFRKLDKPKGDLVTLDEKWELVKAYYEPSYKIKFEARLDDDKIEFLFSEMMKLGESVRKHYETWRPSIIRLIEAGPAKLERPKS